MLLSIEHFADFIKMSEKTYVITDCQAVLWMLRLRQLGVGKVQRMCVRLCSYPFELIVAHIKGANNPADLLTRIHKAPIVVRPKEAKRATVVATPFEQGEVVTLADIIRELERDPQMVHVPLPEPKKMPKDAKMVAAVTVSSLSKELMKLLSKESMIAAQEEDEKIKEIRQKLLLGEQPGSYVLFKGLVSKIPRRGADGDPRVVVPQKLVAPLFAFFHLQCHAGAKTLARMIRATYYVEQLEEQLIRFTGACAACNAYKADSTRKQETGHTPLPLKKASTWIFDLVTGLPPSHGQDSYLSILDPFSSFRIAVPCRLTITAQGIAKILREHVIMPFGIPNTLWSDGGPTMLKSEELQQFCKFYDIDIKVSAPYNAKGHGVVERSNRAITETVSALAEDFGLPWVKVLPLAVARLNSKPRAYFGQISPQMIMTGYDPVRRELGEDQVEGSANIAAFFEELDKRTDELIKEAQKQMLQQNQTLGGIMRHVVPGTSVYLRNHRIRNRKKTHPRFMHLPVTVVHDYGSVVSTKNHAGIISLVHKSNLKVAHERDVRLYESLPVQAKLIMGEPFSHEEVAAAINDGTIPQFWRNKTQKDEEPSRPRTRAAAAAEQAAPDAAQQEATWQSFPYADEADEENEVVRPGTSANVASRRVRFE